MKNVLKLAAGFASAAILFGLSTGAQAQGYPDVSWNINVGSGGTVYAPQPVYRQPPVVVATPGPVVYPAPVYMHPRPVIVAPRPVVMAPAPVYYGYRAPGYYQGRGHWDHGHGRGRWDHGRGHEHGHGHR